MMFRTGLRLSGIGLLSISSFLAHAQTLRQEADQNQILIGAAVRPARFEEPAYTALLGGEFNMVEPEDAMKWWGIRQNKGEFDFRQGDEIVRFAQAHRMKVRGHCLVWDHQNPAWLAQDNHASAQLSDLLHEHISRVVKHYAGQVFAWDVVNEAFDENGKLRDSIWYNQPGIGLSEKGTAYIEQSFRWARESDPRALLFYNETGAEGMSRKSDAIYTMVKDFKARSVPIDGIGFQLHISNLDFDAAPIAANIARLGKLGVQIHITELDVSVPVDANGNVLHKQDLDRQTEVYRNIVRACVQTPACAAIQTWGFTDKYSWIGNHSHHTRGAALPFDERYRPKPAYFAIREELAKPRSSSH